VRTHATRLLVLGATAGLALVLAGAAPTASDIPAAQLFAGAYRDAEGAHVGFGISKFGDGPSMAKTTIYAPAGYGVDFSRTPGLRIGETFVAVLTGSGFASGVGTVTTGDPAALLGDPAAQACAPGAHAAVWVASYKAAKWTGAVRFYVDRTTGAETSLGAFRLIACFASPDDKPEGPYFIQFDLDLGGPGGSVLSSPTKTGTYVWRLLVAPYVDGTTTPDPAATYEARTHVFVPHVLTEHASYRPRSQQLVVTGRLVAAGHPRRRILLGVVAGRHNTALRLLGRTRTRAEGSYSFTARVREGRKARVLEVWVFRSEPSGLCGAPSTAPAGCVDESVSPPSIHPIYVRIPRLPKR